MRRTAGDRQAPAQQPAPDPAPPVAPTPTPTDDPAPDDVVARIQQLAELKSAGMLTDEEFAAAKKKLLG